MGCLYILLMIIFAPFAFNANNKNHKLTYLVNHQVTDNGRLNRTEARERSRNLRQLKIRRLVQTSISTEIVYGNRRTNNGGI